MNNEIPPPDQKRGLYAKFAVYKLSPTGRPIELTEPSFVLRYTTDPHARAAIAAYADSCRDEYPRLAADLDKVIQR